MKTMRSIFGFALAIVLLATVAAAQEPGGPQERQLLETLRSGQPADKALACKQLAIHGTKEAVPELAKLLPDEQLASWARIALESIPDPAAGEALASSLDGLNGKLLVGAINSIGVRGDAVSVERLAKRLKNQDAEVASAAAIALGRIGDEPARKALQESFASASGPVRSAIAEGRILAAERLLAAGQGSAAAEIYDDIRRADLPKQRIVEATRGAILARGKSGMGLLVETLRSPDKRMFQLGLATARELPGPEVSEAVAGQLNGAAPDRAALLLTVLADRPGGPMPPAVLEAAKQGDKQVRIAAIGVVGQLGDAASVPGLLAIASEEDAELSQAAKTAIAGLRGDTVNHEIVARLGNAGASELPILLAIVEARRIDAVAEVMKSLDHADDKVRRAALGALGATAGPVEIPQLLVAAIRPPHSQDAEPAMQALKAACVRMNNREATATLLAAAMEELPVAKKLSLLEILGAMGGSKALETVGAAANSDDAQLQDTGSKLLGAWMTVDAAPVLLALAKDESKTHHARAMRGFLRITRQFAMPDSERAALCEQGLAASSRPEDRQQILEILQRRPSVEGLKVAVHAAQDEKLREQALKVAMMIHQKLGAKAPDARELLKQLALDPVSVEIVKAEYGAGTTQKDVTETLRRQSHDMPLILLPSSSYNESFGGDPAPGVVKQLKVEYRMNGQAASASFAENAMVMLPPPKQ